MFQPKEFSEMQVNSVLGNVNLRNAPLKLAVTITCVVPGFIFYASDPNSSCLSKKNVENAIIPNTFLSGG